ncbi:MAG: cadherin-like domain-containing protein [Pseudomonadota bacterium]
MDATPVDQLRFYGLPLTGGNNALPMAAGPIVGLLSVFGGGLGTVNSSIYYDFLFPWITYHYDRDERTMYVANLFNIIDLFDGGDGENVGGERFRGAMVVRNYDEPPVTFWGSQVDDLPAGDMGFVFKNTNPLLAFLAFLPIPGIGMLTRVLPMIDELLAILGAAERYEQLLKWDDPDDPLILDLDGDGIETVDIDDTDVRFDFDNDFFAERAGWVAPDDGFLTRDLDGDGLIEDVSELIGGEGRFGFDVLRDFDLNGDGVIDALDAVWAELGVWQDLDQDGVTDEGEVKSLDEMGIVSIDLDSAAELGVTTPQGTELLQSGLFGWADGTTGNIFEAIFEADPIDTAYRGKTAPSPWLDFDVLPDAKGFGRVTDLAVAMSNDPLLGQIVETTAAEMNTVDLRVLREQAGDTLSRWSVVQELTRELTAVRMEEVDGKTILADIAAWDADLGGYVLQSGADVTDAGGAVIAVPSLDDVMAMEGWTLEEMFSPTDQKVLPARVERPYLAEIAEGDVRIVDWGVAQADGSWRLASGAPVLDADGAEIALPTLEDVLAQAAPEGLEWRIEEFGTNIFRDTKVEEVGVRQIDGRAVDFTVEVTDRDGTFYVWSRQLDRALELQEKFGEPRDFNLRNYEVVFENLDELDSTTDSTYRVEVLTPGQFHLATSLISVDFDPRMLEASIDPDTGVIDYTVNDTGRASLSPDGDYVSPITPAIEMLELAMNQYIIFSQATAVKMALKGGLSDYARGLEYVVAVDEWQATTDRGLAPIFEAIFENAPDGFDATYDWFIEWGHILAQIYPDYRVSGEGNLYGLAPAMDQRLVMQYMLSAYETFPPDVDLQAAMNAFAINETLLVAHGDDATTVNGTGGTDFIHMTAGDQVYRGGNGADMYFVGQNAGKDTIEAYDAGDADELRFVGVSSKDIIAVRDTQDLILTTTDGGTEIRLIDQFLGELNPTVGQGLQDSGVNAIVFSDGVMWDRFRMAYEVRDPGDDDRTYAGSGSADVLEGGTGNDVLLGGAGGDIYTFRRGDGQDVVEDGNPPSFSPSAGGLDIIRFEGEIGADDVRLERDGESDDLRIIVLDEDGVETGDTILVRGQFGGLRLNLGALGGFAPDLELDYIAPNLIERFVFENGTSLDFEEIKDRVLKNARTDGDDAIFGTLADNETLDGGAGNDVLIGREGGDIYVFQQGYGEDVFRDGDFSIKILGSPPDTLRIEGLGWNDFTYEREGASDDLTMRVTESPEDAIILTDYLERQPFLGYINLIEQIVFTGGTADTGDDVPWSWLQLLQTFVDAKRTDGDDHMFGFLVSDEIDGGLGDDTLEGLGGSDRYIWRSGEGSDIIIDAGGDFDRIIFDGITLAEVSVSRTALDLIFTLDATGETLTLKDQYIRRDAQFMATELFVFADQTVEWTNLNPEDVDLIGTGGADTIVGSNFGEVLDGRGGDDSLVGGSGGDIYRWDAGYGDDVIQDRQLRNAWETRDGRLERERPDVIEFGGGIASRDELIWTKDGVDLLIQISGRPDSLRIQRQFGEEAGDDVYRIERFKFFDGTEMDISDVEELLAIAGGNRGDNLIEGSGDSDDVLDGRQGDDTLIGYGGNDTYAFGSGYDFDVVQDSSGNDRVVFGSLVRLEDLKLRREGDDLLIDLGVGADVLRVVGGLGSQQIERYEFADGMVLTTNDMRDRMVQGTDGDDSIEGFDGRSDTIDGGAGTDFLVGGSGNDEYRFGLGDGDDAIRDTSGFDRIVFSEGITRADVIAELVGEDLVFTLRDSGESLAVLDATTDPVETIVFADGETVSWETVRLEIVAGNDGSPTSDLIDLNDFGTGAEIAPGRGFDTIVGAGDTDAERIVFEEGDGVDVIGANRSTEIVLTDHVSTEAVVIRDAAETGQLTVSLPRTGDRIALPSGLGLGSRIVFADGVSWEQSDLLAAAWAAQADDGNDVIFGGAGDATIEGGPGNDDIDGGGGNTTFLFARGDGHDVIVDTGGVDDILVTGYAPDDLKVSRPVLDREEVLLSFADGADTILLRGGILSGNNINNVVFSDGTTITRDDINQLVIGTGTEADDIITGTSARQTIEGGGGDDLIDGAGGGDVYVFRRGDGADVITGFDTGAFLRLPDIPREDVTLVRQDRDLLVLIEGGDEILVRGHWPSSSTSTSRGLSSIQFNDDSVMIWFNIDDVVEANNQGNDRLSIGSGLVDGGLGNDYLRGGSSSHEYFFERGDGRDVIDDSTWSGSSSDTLRLSGYTMAEAQWRAVNEGVVISFTTSKDEIYVRDALYVFSGTPPILRGGIIFDDGTMSIQQVAQAIVDQQGTDGPDAIRGSRIAEFVRVTPGDDSIWLGAGQDTVLYEAGDGRVQISGNSSGKTIILDNHVPADVDVKPLPGDDFGLRLDFGNGDLIEIPGNGSFTILGTLVFDDGTEVTGNTLLGSLALGIPPSTSGDDTVQGTAADNILTGQAGDDVILTEGGSDTITWVRGDGNDTIVRDSAEGGSWTLNLIGADITAADVTIVGPLPTLGGSFDPLDYEVRIAGPDGGTIYVQSANYGLDRLTGSDFDWNEDQIEARLVPYDVPDWVPVRIETTDASEVFQGTPRSEVFDTLFEDGTDTYQLDRFGGNDRILTRNFSNDGFDTVEIANVASTEIQALRGLNTTGSFFTDDDLILFWGEGGHSVAIGDAFSGGLADPESDFLVSFADGVSIAVRDLAETAVSIPTGDLSLTRGVDTGLHFIQQESESGRLELDLNGVTADEITAERLDGDILLQVAARAADGSDAMAIRVFGALTATGFAVTLDDGTILGAQDIIVPLVSQTGTADDDVLVGMSVNPDRANLDITLEGGLGDDTVMSGVQNGETRVVYTRGDGNDLIHAGTDTDGFSNGFPVLDLRGIAPGDVSFTAFGSDLFVTIAETAPGAGDGGRLHMVDAMTGDDGVGSSAPRRAKLGEVAFDDGSRLSASDILALIRASEEEAATSGDDYKAVSDAGVVIHEMGGGDDVVVSERSSDTYIYRSGDGHDSYSDSDDVGKYGKYGKYGPGFYGGKYGKYGPPSAPTSNDVLHLPDLLSSQVAIERRGDDLRVVVPENVAEGIKAGSILMPGAFAASDKYGELDVIETIRFADGEDWDTESVMRAMVDDQATAGDDTIRGIDAPNEILRGGAGDDVVTGLSRDGTFIWARGDGNDILQMISPTIELRGVTADALSYDASGQSLRIDIADSAEGAGDGGSITVEGALVELRGGFSSLTPYGDNLRIELDDGTVITEAGITAAVLAGDGTDGPDILVGSDFADTLIGGAGADSMSGEDGGDTYIYRNGDGRDVITDTGRSWSGTDKLEFVGVDPSRVTVTRNLIDSSDFELIIAESRPGAGDYGRITLNNSSSWGIEQVVFEDGTIWTRSTLSSLVNAQGSVTDGPDRISGGSGNDVLAGGLGDDTLQGGSGNDVYQFTRGDGSDVVIDTSGLNVLRLVGYSEDEVTLRRPGRDGTDLIVELSVSGDQVLLVDGLRSFSAFGSIEIVDAGVTLDRDAILDAIAVSAAGPGDDLVLGTSSAETLTGGAGNDLLQGEGGGDTYLYRSGDGDDRIAGARGDRLELVDLNPDDVAYAARTGLSGQDLLLRLSGERDRIIINDALTTGLDEILFADGKTWTRVDMMAAVVRDADTPGNDRIEGFDRSTDPDAEPGTGLDTLRGAEGDDTLAGGSGNDLYIVRRGDGHDLIEDDGVNLLDPAFAAFNDIDRLTLDDFVSSETAVTRAHTGSDDVTLTFVSAPDQSVTLRNVLSDDGQGVDRVIFSDGVTWDRDTLLVLTDNRAPVARSDGYFTGIGQEPLTIAVAELLRNDFDPDGDDLSIISVDGGEAGFAELNADGNVVFTAAEGFFGPTTLRYVLSDGRSGQAVGEVDIRIRPKAEARDDSGFTVKEDGSITIESARLLSNDLDGDRMIIGQVRDAENGQVSLASNGEVTFTPNANYNGEASFTYIGNTPEGGRAEARVTLIVTPENDAPTAGQDGTFVTDEDVPFQIDASELLANDADIDGDTLAVTAVQSSADVVVVLEDGVITVTPRDSFFGSTSFTYTLSDGQGRTATGTVRVRVEPVNDNPLPLSDRIETYQGEPIREDNPIVINVNDLLANDIDVDGDTMTVVSVQDIGNSGDAELLDNGTILYTPRANFNGTAQFRYLVEDGQGGSGSATVQIVYEAVNDNPVARDDSYTNRTWLRGLEDQPMIIPVTSLLENDFDVDGDDLSFRSVSDPENGEVELSADGRSVIFTPDPFYWGEAVFFYTIGDEENLVDGAKVTMWFENVGRDAPIAVDDDFEVFEDSELVIPPEVLLGNDIERDRDPMRIVNVVQTGFPKGELSVNDDGNFVFTPDLNENGRAFYNYVVTDDIDGSDVGEITITIIPVNDEPIAGEDDLGLTPFNLPMVIRISELIENDTDVDEDDVLFFAGIDGVTEGTASIYGNQFIVIEFDRDFTGEVRLDYLVTDGRLSDQGSGFGEVDSFYSGIQFGTDLRDLIFGNELDEIIEAFDGNDDIFVGAGADSVDAGAGDDLVELGTGNDTVLGGAGDDTILAGEGDDFIDGGDDADSIDGGAGRDTVSYEGSDIGVRADLQARIGQGGWAQGDVFLGVEDLIGSAWRDGLGGDQTDNLLRGLDGDDLLRGRDGADTLEGDAGDDTLEGGVGGDVLDGGDGRDAANYEFSAEGVQVDLAAGTATGGDAAGDTLLSIEDLIGSDNGDVLTGDAGDNALIGLRGDDVLDGGTGDDSLSGGRGADTLRGGEGVDIADYFLSAEGVHVDMNDGASGGGDAEGDVFEGIEIVRGSFHDDTITGDAADNIIRGGYGADIITGGDGIRHGRLFGCR